MWPVSPCSVLVPLISLKCAEVSLSLWNILLLDLLLWPARTPWNISSSRNPGETHAENGLESRLVRCDICFVSFVNVINKAYISQCRGGCNIPLLSPSTFHQAPLGPWSRSGSDFRVMKWVSKTRWRAVATAQARTMVADPGKCQCGWGGFLHHSGCSVTICLVNINCYKTSDGWVDNSNEIYGLGDVADDVVFQKGDRKRWIALGREEEWLQFWMCQGWSLWGKGWVAGFSKQVERRVWIPENRIWVIIGLNNTVPGILLAFS